MADQLQVQHLQKDYVANLHSHKLYSYCVSHVRPVYPVFRHLSHNQPVQPLVPSSVAFWHLSCTCVPSHSAAIT